MAKGFDISVLGLEKLEKKFDRMTRGQQGKILRPAIRDSAKRAKDRVVANLGGLVLTPKTGDTLKAFQKASVRSAARSRDEIRIGQSLPERELLGIAADDKHYYPMALEYGHKRARAYPFIRPAIDNHYANEVKKIGDDVGDRITKVLKR